MYTLYLNNVTQINKEMLNSVGVKALLLDIDNTIKVYGASKPFSGVMKWVREMEKQNIKIILFSNNYKKVVEPFAESMGLPFVAFALKPSPVAYFRAKKMLNVNFSEIMIVGDQVFTDIFGAKLVGVKSMLVDPVDVEKEGATVKIRRIFTGGAEGRIKSRGLYMLEE